jgi:hypothetical protein
MNRISTKTIISMALAFALVEVQRGEGVSAER